MKRVIPVSQPGDITIYVPDPPESQEPAVPEPAKTKKAIDFGKFRFMALAILLMLGLLIGYQQFKKTVKQATKVNAVKIERTTTKQWVEMKQMPDGSWVRIWRGIP